MTSDEAAGSTKWTDWLAASALPLGSIEPGAAELAKVAAMIGRAKIVALGEADHFLSAPLRFRNALFRHLVEAEGFTAIALESGIVEGRLVHDYVRGAPRDLAQVMDHGFCWGFGRIRENVELITWMRERNSRAPARPVNFYGFDTPGVSGRPPSELEPLALVRAALDAAAGISAATADSFLRRLDSLDAGASDSRLALIVDVIAWIERLEGELASTGSSAEYAWLHRSVVAAAQSEVRRRSAVSPSADLAQLFDRLAGGPDTRDRAQADNMRWIVQQEGAAGRLLINGHNAHMASHDIAWACHSSEDGVSARELALLKRHPAVSYLRRWFAQDLVSICHLAGFGREAPAESADNLAAEGRMANFAIDLRGVGAAVAERLARRRPIGRRFGYIGRMEVEVRLALRPSFDLAVYTADARTSDTVSDL